MVKQQSPIIIPPGAARPLDISQQLIKAENEEAMMMVAKHLEKIKRVREGLIELLIKEECNWGDWGEVIDSMNKKSTTFFPKITIKEFEAYGK